MSKIRRPRYRLKRNYKFHTTSDNAIIFNTRFHHSPLYPFSPFRVPLFNLQFHLWFMTFYTTMLLMVHTTKNQNNLARQRAGCYCDRRFILLNLVHTTTRRPFFFFSPQHSADENAAGSFAISFYACTTSLPPAFVVCKQKEKKNARFNTRFV